MEYFIHHMSPLKKIQMSCTKYIHHMFGRIILAKISKSPPQGALHNQDEHYVQTFFIFYF